MSLWLSGDYRGKRIHHLLPSGATRIGRSESSDVVLPSQTVSRNHAEVHVEGDRVTVIDLGSLNGTRVSGVDLETARAVQPGDVIEFGSVSLRLTDGTESSSPTFTDDREVSKSLHLSRDDTSEGALGGAEPQLLRLLSEAGSLLVLPDKPEETFDRLLELVERTIPASRILILLSDNDGEPVQRAARVHGDRAISPLMLSRTMVQMVLEDGSSFLTGDAQSDERFKNQQSVVVQDLHSAMAVPLEHHEDVLGVLYVDTNDPLATYAERDLRVLTLLGQMLGAKIANAKLLELAREQERLRGELRTATTIQRRLLPQDLPQIEGYEILGMQDTCEEVGGDLYDAGVLPDGGVQIVLGDVSGKGIGAALIMSDVLATIRALRTVQISLDILVGHLDRHLLQTTEPEHYVTLFVADLNLHTHCLDYVNAGHPPAFLLMPGGGIQELSSTAPPAGLMDLPGIEFERKSVEMPPGSTLVIYSDGISEAERGELGATIQEADEGSREQFGDHEFQKVLSQGPFGSSSECARRIHEAVEGWLAGSRTPDDTTLVVVRREN
jgi:serine phosphatase RsbU (regulator of sigma subunit)/pSer/pThr/pTyr-binding forkhead associated (FHA) protein